MLAGQQIKTKSKIDNEILYLSASKNQKLVQKIIYTEMHFWQNRGLNEWYEERNDH